MPPNEGEKAEKDKNQREKKITGLSFQVSLMHFGEGLKCHILQEIFAGAIFCSAQQLCFQCVNNRRLFLVSSL